MVLTIKHMKNKHDHDFMANTPLCFVHLFRTMSEQILIIPVLLINVSYGNIKP